MPTSDLREQHARETRRTIRSVALALARERGYAAMTVDDVAERAGVSRRTVFNHFPTKADLIVSGPQLPDEAHIDTFITSRGDLIEDMRDLIVSGLRDINLRPGELRSLRDIVRDNPELRPRIHDKVRACTDVLVDAAAQRLATDRDDMRAAIVVDLVGMIHRIAYDRWATLPNDSALSLVDIVHQVCDSFRDLTTSVAAAPAEPAMSAAPAKPAVLAEPGLPAAPADHTVAVTSGADVDSADSSDCGVE